MKNQGFKKTFSKKTDFSEDYLKRKLIGSLIRLSNGSDYPHLLASLNK